MRITRANSVRVACRACSVRCCSVICSLRALLAFSRSAVLWATRSSSSSRASLRAFSVLTRHATIRVANTSQATNEAKKGMSRGFKAHVRNGGTKKYCTAMVLMKTASQPGPFPQIHVAARIAVGKRNQEGLLKGSCKPRDPSNAARTKRTARKYRRGAFISRNIGELLTAITSKKPTHHNKSSRAEGFFTASDRLEESREI